MKGNFEIKNARNGYLIKVKYEEYEMVSVGKTVGEAFEDVIMAIQDKIDDKRFKKKTLKQFEE